MDSLTLVIILLFLFLILSWTLFAALLTYLARWVDQKMKDQEKYHQEQRIAWEVERERLLNRAMTKEWQSYAQMMERMVSPFSSISDEPVAGMSDAEEIRRYGSSVVNGDGIGEVLFDEQDDLVELGLRPE